MVEVHIQTVAVQFQFIVKLFHLVMSWWLQG
jgi:hypothetical protein